MSFWRIFSFIFSMSFFMISFSSDAAFSAAQPFGNDLVERVVCASFANDSRLVSSYSKSPSFSFNFGAGFSIIGSGSGIDSGFGGGIIILDSFFSTSVKTISNSSIVGMWPKLSPLTLLSSVRMYASPSFTYV